MTTQVKKTKRKRSPGLVAGIVVLFLGIILLITLAMFASFDEVTNVFEAGKVDIVLTETEWNPTDGDQTVPNTFIDKNPAIVNKEETVNTYVFLKVTVPYDDDPHLIIEKAHQDDTAHSGEVAYTNEGNLIVPIYKFVATGKKEILTEGENWTDPTPLSHYYEPDCNSLVQKTNPGWYLLNLGTGNNPKIDNAAKTITYIYAYVRTDKNNQLIDANGQPLPSGSKPLLEELIHGHTTKYPLFNKIYLQNFRERDEVVNQANEVTQTPFPNPAQNYNVHIEAYGIQAQFLKPNNTTTADPEDVWTYYINKP